MVQAPVLDGLSFDPSSFQQDGLAPPEVDIGEHEFAQALVVVAVMVVLDEGFDVSLEPVSHNEAMSLLLSGQGEVTGHFTAAPFYQHETAAGMHRALDSYEVFGGSHTYGMIWVAQKFVDDNPKVIQVLLEAITEATDYINKDPKGAAQAYIDSANSKLKPEFVESILRNPKNIFTMTPESTMKYHVFMRKIGMVKRGAASWKDMFSPVIHHLSGS